jgi:hypothetical protein
MLDGWLPVASALLRWVRLLGLLPCPRRMRMTSLLYDRQEKCLG